MPLPLRKVVLLTLLAAAAYLPSLRAGYFVFDDSGIVFSLQHATIDQIADYFTDRSGTYWRPLITASHLVDRFLWGLSPTMMHLGNLLLHIANTLSLFCIARLLLPPERQDAAMLVAALFCLHPINTESVNWISGRTDPLAALFCLIALHYLFQWRNEPEKLRFCYLSGSFFFVGCLAKEVAFGLMIGAALFCLANTPRDNRHRQPNRFARLLPALPFVMFALVYWQARAWHLAESDRGIGSVLAGTMQTPAHSQIQSAVTALGFYSKKLMFPTPLTFAIDHVSAPYALIGVFAILVAGWCLLRHRLLGSMLILMMASIAPAIVNAVHQIAWTPYAERYLYLASALYILAICVVLSRIEHPQALTVLLLGMLVLYYLPVTVRRNLLWSDQAAFLHVAVQQAPDNPILRNNYGVVLAKQGRIAEARSEFDVAEKLSPGNELIIINQKTYGAGTVPAGSLRGKDQEGSASTNRDRS